MAKVATFNPADFVSDKPVTDKERNILDKLLTDTKVQLFFKKKSGFVASLVTTMEFIWDRTIPTACTNGVFMAWNPEFFLTLSDDTRVTVLAHEAWHVAFQHMLRCETRQPQVYNHAADYVINGMLEDHGYDMSGFPYLLDKKYKGKSTEEVYDELYKQYKQNGQLKEVNVLDGDFKAPGTGPDSLNGGKTPEQIKAKAQANVVKASTIAKMSKDAGNLPGEVKLMIDKFLNPKLPWEAILANFFEALTAEEYSYRRINRRYVDPILPGKAGVNGLEHLIYYLDISGSVSDKDITRFNSEVKHIKEYYNPEKLTLVTFDTEIHDEYVFEKEDEFEQIIVTGRGGTDLDEVFKHAKANSPTAVVIFSDMWVSIPEEKPKYPVVWIASGNKTVTVPYGALVHIESEDHL